MLSASMPSLLRIHPSFASCPLPLSLSLAFRPFPFLHHNFILRRRPPWRKRLRTNDKGRRTRDKTRNCSCEPPAFSIYCATQPEPAPLFRLFRLETCGTWRRGRDPRGGSHEQPSSSIVPIVPSGLSPTGARAASRVARRGAGRGVLAAGRASQGARGRR